MKRLRCSTVVVVLAVAAHGVFMLPAAAAGKQVTYEGKVRDTAGRPVAGAEVVLYERTGSVGSDTGYEIKRLDSMTTGPDGAFSFETGVGGTYRDATIVARRPGLALGWGSWAMREDQQQDIRLTEPKQLSGVVVDAEGKPVLDATVFVAAGQIGTREDEQRYVLAPLSRRLLSTRSDASGRFVLSGLSADATFELGAHKSGYAIMTTIDRSRRTETCTFAPGKIDIKLVMQPEVRIEGRVVQQGSGEPVADVPVTIRGEQMVPYLLPDPVRSQKDGTFSFAGLPPDAYTVSVGVPAEGMPEWVGAPVQMTLEAGQAKTDVTVEIGKGGLVEFVIVDAASGKPIEGARVGTRRMQDGQWFFANSNEQGIARLRLSPGSYHLTRVSKAGYARDPEDGRLAIAEGESQRLKLSLAATPRLTGVIRDPEGQPVAGALVSVLPGSRGEAVSDENGRYEATWDPSMWRQEDTTFCLLARHVQRNLAAAVEMAADTQSLDVILGAGMTLTGKVVGSDNRDLDGARIMPSLRMSNWGASIARTEAHAAADGTFAITGLPRNQRYAIYARASGYGQVSHDVEVDLTRGERADIGALVLPVANLSVSGQVVDVDGHPVAGGAKVIAGVAVDESGAPVASVPVGVCCHKTIREDGRMGWSYSSFPTLRDTTDTQGRFAIELENDGQYNLLFSPDRHAATIVYDVPVNTKALKVVLEAGGTLEGRLASLEGGQKVPIPHAELKLEQSSRASYTHLGFDRDQTTLTDAQGRFRFEHIQTAIRPMGSRNETQWTPIPRVWTLSYGDATETVAFTDGKRIEDFELLVKPNIDTAAPLVGNRLPSFEGIAVEFDGEQTEGKAVLLCFFDYQQRPSRNTVMQLARQAESLGQKGIVLVAIQAAETETAALRTWAETHRFAFPLGTITGDIEATRAVWHVKSLPWLILTDRDHVVTAEGFSLEEIEDKIQSAGS